jgi:large subunit ribosomal protein L5
MEENPLHAIRIEKVTLNVGCGDDKAKIERAQKLLQMLTEKKPKITKSKRRSTFGVAKGKSLGVMVTLRKKSAEEFLKNVLQSLGNKIKSSQFDKEGNFSIGVREYIDLPGVKYSHDIGMLGLDVSVTLERAGFHISKRRAHQTKIPKKHKINKEESMEWVKHAFGVDVVD